ncbi:hypothetical protein VQ300_004872 [Salmonella enterica]|nr:hypothetical protein [Salmonella enterica]
MDFSVKKIVLAVVACSSFAGASSVMADTGNPTVTAGKVSTLTMHIIGNVSKSTCDIRPYTTAGADATTLNMGTMTSGTASPTVSFFLKPVDGCNTGITGDSPSTAAEITWESSGLTEHGISNMYGTAKNVHIELSPVNEGGVAETDMTGIIKTGAQTVAYKTIATAALSSTPLPFKYDVKLVPDSGDKLTEVGTIDTDMSYTVAYK